MSLVLSVGASSAVETAPLPTRLIDVLACPTCHARLEQRGPAQVRCTGCGLEYPVSRGVPRLLPGALPPPVAQTAEAFGWQWHAFSEQHAAFRTEALEWLNPVTAADFVGKSVLDAGCGAGRHVALAADFGAAHVVGLDLSAAVDVAHQVTRDLPAVDIVQGDLMQPPIEDGAFDLIYSIGVIHHTPSPAQAIRALARCVRPGGTLHVWCYGYEGNRLVRWVLDPVRRWLARNVPRRIPRQAVRAATLPAAVLLAVAARLARALDGTPAAHLLPYQKYFRGLSGFSLRHVWQIAYDQLMAPTTHYIKGPELGQWFREAGLVDVRVRDSRGMSWTGTGRRP
ncbi:MAG TPA: methyltransferase domain-containing protein [Chloroflexota bacterium]|jgi:SAM-dependent methyltransferase